MADPRGFLKTRERELPARRPVPIRLMDWREVYEAQQPGQLQRQAGRCMDCGIPFCHQGCPLGNLIPEWNDLTWRDDWREAMERLHATNNFPEFTGRLCPAPCESACVLGINQPPVTIKQVEVSIVERAFETGGVHPQPPERLTGKTVAIVGSGPAGLAAAQQLTRAGHTVAVYERADRIGGLLRYGIPEFKMEKAVLDRRLRLMEAEGVVFKPGCDVGVSPDAATLKASFDAVVLACGVPVGRDLPIPGRELEGIHFAMDYLPLQNKRCEGDAVKESQFISAKDKHVVIIGGGDTGADCLGTAHRQGARSVHQLELLPKPPAIRAVDNPWPQWPNIFRVSSAHEEGGERLYSVATSKFLGDDKGRVRALAGSNVQAVKEDGRLTFKPVPGTEFELPADLVLLAMGFTSAEPKGLVSQLGLALTPRGTVQRDGSWMTSVPGVFVTGDMQRGQSLIVWAIADGRSTARGVDGWLMGASELPAPVQ
jgi:glutamate synthase (NADPH) small chain